jgi:tetratricopeptide (TPR) repeat protein
MNNLCFCAIRLQTLKYYFSCIYSSPPILSKEEKHAQRLVQHGKVDEALALYQHLKRHSPRILNTMGQLYADKKGDYNSALKYYEQAMKIQEEVYRYIFVINEFKKIVLFCIEWG